MNQAGALIRVSTERQLEGTSPEKQLETIQQLASRHGYALNPENIWQVAESGAKQDRLGFSQVLEAVKEGGISRLYVFSIDRLGRDLRGLLNFLWQMEEVGVEVWTADKEERLQNDDFLVQILGAVASLERRQIYQRTQDGLKRAIKDGKYSGGIIAYGYQLNPDTKRLEINEEETKVVRMIFDWCIHEHQSCTVIADRLNAMGIPTRYVKDARKVHYRGKRSPENTTGLWRSGRVRNMLKNTAYYGDWMYGKRSKKKDKNLIKGYSPAIISKADFEKAQEVLLSNRLFEPDKPHRKYLLRGLIHCGNCGKAYCGSVGKVGPNKSREKRYYRCNGVTQWRKLGCPKCSSKSLVADEIESIVWSDVQGYIMNPDVIVEQLKRQKKPVDSTLPVRIKDIEQQIRELEREEANLIRMAAQSREIDITTLDKLLKENRSHKENLVEYLVQLRTEEEFAQTLDKGIGDLKRNLQLVGSRIEDATWEEKRKAVCELVKGVVVTTTEVDGKIIREVDITYKFDGLFTCSSVPAYIMGCTPAHAVIMETPRGPAPAPLPP